MRLEIKDIGIDVHISESQAYEWHLKSWEWMQSPRERVKRGEERAQNVSQEFQHLQVR